MIRDQHMAVRGPQRLCCCCLAAAHPNIRVEHWRGMAPLQQKRRFPGRRKKDVESRLYVRRSADANAAQCSD